MFGAPLRYHETPVGCIHNLLRDPVHLVAEHQSQFLPICVLKGLKALCFLSLLNCQHTVTISLQASYCIKGILAMLPWHTILSSESGLVYLSGRRTGTDATEIHPVDLERITTAEGAANIVRAADIVQYNNEPRRRQLPVLFGVYSTEFSVEKLAVPH